MQKVSSSSASRSVNVSVIHMLDCSIIMNVSVEQRTTNMVLLGSQAVRKSAMTILGRCVEVTIKTLYIRQANREDYFKGDSRTIIVSRRRM